MKTATKRKKAKLEVEAAYRPGFSCPVDPQAAHEELESVRAKHDGVLRPSDVVDESRPDDAPLHPVFTWDDHKAAESWREDEARRLIRNVCIVTQPAADDQPREVRPVYIHTRQEEGPDTQGYRPVAVVMAAEDMRRAAIADALAQLRGWQKRYGWISELGCVSVAIDEAAKLNAEEPVI